MADHPSSTSTIQFPYSSAQIGLAGGLSWSKDPEFPPNSLQSPLLPPWQAPNLAAHANEERALHATRLPTPSKAPSSLPGRPQTWQPTPMKSARFTPLVSSAASTSRDGESTGCRDGGRELVCSAGRSVARGASSAGGGPGPPLHPVFCLESPWPIAQVSRSRARQVQGAGVHTPWHPSFTLLRHNQLTPMWHKPTPQGPTLTPRDARTSSTVRAMKGLGVNLQTHGAGVRVGRGRLGLAK